MANIFNKIEIPQHLKLDPPTESQAKCLRQLLLIGFFDHVARKIPATEILDENKSKYLHGYKVC